MAKSEKSAYISEKPKMENITANLISATNDEEEKTMLNKLCTLSEGHHLLTQH